LQLSFEKLAEFQTPRQIKPQKRENPAEAGLSLGRNRSREGARRLVSESGHRNGCRTATIPNFLGVQKPPTGPNLGDIQDGEEDEAAKPVKGANPASTVF
jgi:hypothetical protein